MVALERMMPIVVLILEALLRRTKITHPRRKEMEEAYRTFKAGYNGEKSVDYFLTLLDEQKFQIFKGVRLVHNGNIFQIDTLLVTPFFAIILEIKNWAGEVTFDKNFCQVTQVKDGEVYTYTNPISQAKLQLLLLKKWLTELNMGEIPLHFIVVMSNQKTRLKADPGYYEVFNKVVHSIRLIEKIDEIDKKYNKQCLSSEELRTLTYEILQNHNPQHPEILKKYSITPYDILIGVQCPECLKFSMKSTKGRWYCTFCKHYSKTAHLKAVKDYFLLISPVISNKQLRWFLNFTSSKKAHSLLVSMNLPHTGTKKGRIYHQPR